LQAADGIRDRNVTGVQTCALPILLIALGGVLGYGIPSVLIQGLHWYAPAVIEALFYLPALVGLYMVLLHTVVNGWGGKKGKYREIGRASCRASGEDAQG